MRIGALGTAVVIALSIVGCEGALSIEDRRPHVELDGAVPARDGGAPPSDRDGGEPPIGSDAGAPPTERDAGPDPVDRDAGPDPVEPDAGPPPDPCGGLDGAGVCEGSVARWCEGGTVREENCAASGRICADVAAGRRCTEPPPPPCGNAIEQEELRLTNAARAAAGLGPLTCDEGLTRAARGHSQDMCDRGYFSHTSLDGRTFRDRIDAEGVRWSTIGENIARGQRTPAAVHDAWMGSAGHRANILNGSFGRIGIGYVECPGGSGPYWTQNFAD